MAIGRYREQVLESLALSVIKGYDATLATGAPRAIPIEDIIEQHYGLKVEYQILSKKGSIQGPLLFAWYPCNRSILGPTNRLADEDYSKKAVSIN